jgi:hypothetical protein
MKISNDWRFDDPVSGLRFQVMPGNRLDRLHIEGFPQGPAGANRDLWFDKEGKFDGTGSSVCEEDEGKGK